MTVQETHPLEPSDASSAFHAAAVMLMPLSLGMGFAFFHLLLMYMCSAVDPSVLPDLMDTRACAPLSSTLTAVAEASGARDSSTSDTAQHANTCQAWCKAQHLPVPTML